MKVRLPGRSGGWVDFAGTTPPPRHMTRMDGSRLAGAELDACLSRVLRGDFASAPSHQDPKPRPAVKPRRFLLQLGEPCANGHDAVVEWGGKLSCRECAYDRKRRYRAEARAAG